MVNSNKQECVLVLSGIFTSVVLYICDTFGITMVIVVSERNLLPTFYTSFIAFAMFLIAETASGYPSMKQVIWKTNAKKFNTVYNMDCAFEIPSRVFTGVGSGMSKVTCALLCLGESGCRGVNWKEPNSCELFFYTIYSFVAVKDCIYFSPGEVSPRIMSSILEWFCFICLVISTEFLTEYECYLLLSDF